jgi:hypothetical protein
VRILDAVEDDDQRRVRRRTFHQVAQAVVEWIVDIGDDALVHASASRAIDRGGINALDLDPSRACESERFLDAAIAARTDAKPPHASAA